MSYVRIRNLATHKQEQGPGNISNNDGWRPSSAPDAGGQECELNCTLHANEVERDSDHVRDTARSHSTEPSTHLEEAVHDLCDERNPYALAPAPDGLDGFATPWQIWFEAVDAVNREALKTKVPAGLHSLIDGRERCPECGSPLGYRPWETRAYLVETCKACGHEWLVEDATEHERRERWADWQRAHGKPTSWAEAIHQQFERMQAEEREDDVEAGTK